jgi:hypothetical protein
MIALVRLLLAIFLSPLRGAIAKALNEGGVRTPRGGRWHPMSVKLVMLRVAKQTAAAA